MPPRGGGSIPDRWEMYSKLGQTVSETPFIAFKVPLKEFICGKLPKEEQFTPSHLISSVESLGLVIDLTNTTRYYDPGVFIAKNILYKKIFFKGRELPPQSILNDFYQVVDTFARDTSRKGQLIGVHCTHGVNRTGFLICKYMIERLCFEVEDAITAFETARGHKMEREVFLNGIRKPFDLPSSLVSLKLATGSVRDNQSRLNSSRSSRGGEPEHLTGSRESRRFETGSHESRRFETGSHESRRFETGSGHSSRSCDRERARTDHSFRISPLRSTSYRQSRPENLATRQSVASQLRQSVGNRFQHISYGHRNRPPQSQLDRYQQRQEPLFNSQMIYPEHNFSCEDRASISRVPTSNYYSNESNHRDKYQQRSSSNRYYNRE